MRIEYIDKLKGLAIILVVMGHVAEKGIGINDTPFNIFYSSFHMPLFMFLSGIFAYKSFKKCDVAEFVTFLKKKTLRLILPLLTIGGDILCSSCHRKRWVSLTLYLDTGSCRHCFIA